MLKDEIQNRISNGIESQVKGKNGGAIVFGVAALAVVGWVAVKITEIVAPLLTDKAADSDSNVCINTVYDNSSGENLDYSDSDGSSDEFEPIA